eukprot:6188792-Pleurochrysis_carterae.AAC.1
MKGRAGMRVCRLIRSDHLRRTCVRVRGCHEVSERMVHLTLSGLGGGRSEQTPQRRSIEYLLRSSELRKTMVAATGICRETRPQSEAQWPARAGSRHGHRGDVSKAEVQSQRLRWRRVRSSRATAAAHAMCCRRRTILSRIASCEERPSAFRLMNVTKRTL